MPPEPRDLVWDGCLNVRDLGGLETAGGGRTRYGAVVRADDVHQLSDEGWRALVHHGIRTVLDLRGDHEREDDPPAELPVEVVHVPFMEASEAEWEEIAEEIEAAAVAAPDVASSTRDVYLIFLERFKANVAASVRALAYAPEGGIVIHCVGGKDRTGLLVAFLLHLAGVDDRESPPITRSARSACCRGTRPGSRPRSRTRNWRACSGSPRRPQPRWRACSRSSSAVTEGSRATCAPRA